MNFTKKKPAILSLQYHSYPDAVGGAWNLTHEINRRLVKRGYRVVIITCKPSNDYPDQEVINGVEFIRIEYAVSKHPMRLWSAIRKKVKNYMNEPENWVAHVHHPLVGAFALTEKRYRKIPKIYHFHSSWYDEEKINLIEVGQNKIKLYFIKGSALNFMKFWFYSFGLFNQLLRQIKIYHE